MTDLETEIIKKDKQIKRLISFYKKECKIYKKSIKYEHGIQSKNSEELQKLTLKIYKNFIRELKGLT